MSDLSTEAQAEELLIGAVMGGDTQDLDAPEKPVEQEAVEDEGEEQDEKPDPKAKEAKAAVEEEEAPEEDEIEVEAEDGTKSRHKVADVLRKAQEYDRFETQKAQIVERIERETTEQATGRLRQVEHAGTQMAYMIQASLQVLQPPRAPDASAMLNPASQQYDPDGYHRQYAEFQQRMQSYQQAQGLGREMYAQAQAAADQAKGERETAELQRLQRVWPEFGQRDTMDKFVSEMEREYGFSPQELDDVLVDHRQALVARDALAFRAMKAKSGDVKAKVEAKAPKLVRSKQEAKGGATQRDRDGAGRFTGGALADLKKTNSDEAATRLFAGLIKDRRI